MEDFDVGLPPYILPEDDKTPQDESDVELPLSVGDESGLDLPSPVASSGEQDHNKCACNRKCQTRIDVEVVKAIQKELSSAGRVDRQAKLFNKVRLQLCGKDGPMHAKTTWTINNTPVCKPFWLGVHNMGHSLADKNEAVYQSRPSNNARETPENAPSL